MKLYDEYRIDTLLSQDDDRSEFRKHDGMWRSEPDKSQWYDEATGLPCLAVRGPLGSWCGYVGVHEGHPWYQRSYSDDEGDLAREAEVHGGLTYSNWGSDERINFAHHSGEPLPVWWLGFDCAHCFDFVPGMLSLSSPASLRLWETGIYRTLDYVRLECAGLAALAFAVQRPPRWRDQALLDFSHRAVIVCALLAAGGLVLTGCVVWRTLF